jgi:colanic acid biosynthesis protein WcaH
MLAAWPALTAFRRFSPVPRVPAARALALHSIRSDPATMDTTYGAAMLSEVDFLTVVRLAPLVSIDLIVTDGNRHILVGRRRNRPAQGTWFVPGGRIAKDESLDVAFTRIAHNELGVASMARSGSRFFGVYEHRYDDNFSGAGGFGTHYVVLAYALTLSATAAIGRFDQHSEYQWLLRDELLARDDVHENTKAYFR